MSETDADFTEPGTISGGLQGEPGAINLENRLSFVVERVFSTVEAALNFIAQHADAVPAQGNVTLYNRSGTGQVTRTLAGAVVAEVECVEHVGVSCKFQYTITGNGPWN